MAKVTLPAWPDTPAMVPFSKTLVDGGYAPLRFVAGVKGDSDDNWQRFAVQNVADLTRRTIGNATHLEAAYTNAFKADALLRGFGEKIEVEHLPIDLRANNAAVNIMVAVGMLHSAILVHMRENWHQHAALILCRSALELAARAAVLAITTGNEPSLWWDGARLPSDRERREAELKAGACCEMIVPLVRTANPTATPPRRIYDWLCGYTHLDSVAIRAPHSSEATYAAIAYTGWLCAVVAETVADWPGLAQWPTVWPDPLPWA
jgi:hypothetical protein